MDTRNQERWGSLATGLYGIAIWLANRMPGFYQARNAEEEDKIAVEFAELLRHLAKARFGSDFRETRIGKDAKHAFDFYIASEGSVIELELGTDNPLSDYEKDIFKCLCAKEAGARINSLLFITRPGASLRDEAAANQPIREMIWKHFRVWVDVLELVPNPEADRWFQSMIDAVAAQLRGPGTP